jgi:hypothetical protein
MNEIYKIVDYLSTLGFVVNPCLIPKDGWERFKMDYIASKKSSIFKFIIKKFPLQYLDERPEKSIWLGLKQNKRTIVEIELKPKSKAYPAGFMTFEYDKFDFTEWKVNLMCDGKSESFFLYMNNHDYDECIEEIEYHFIRVPILKEIIRDKKLEAILNG